MIIDKDGKSWQYWVELFEVFSDIQNDPFVGFPSCEEAIPFSLIPLVTFGE